MREGKKLGQMGGGPPLPSAFQPPSSGSPLPLTAAEADRLGEEGEKGTFHLLPAVGPSVPFPLSPTWAIYLAGGASPSQTVTRLCLATLKSSPPIVLSPPNR